MTTERAPKQAPRGLTGLEAKLSLVALLGAIYTAAWLTVAGPTAPSSAPSSAGPRRAKADAAVARAPRSSAAGRVRTRSS